MSEREQQQPENQEMDRTGVRLTLKQRLFVEFYLGRANGNASKAAKLAGYAEPGQEGYRLLKNAQIQHAISLRVAEAAMAADEVLARLAAHARGTLDDFLDEEGRVDLDGARQAGALHLLKKYACEEVYEGASLEKLRLVRKLRLEMYDAQNALVQIGRHHGLFTDKTDHTSGGEPFKVYQGVDVERV